MFLVVQFPEPDVPEIVPSSWVNKVTSTVKWPPYPEPEDIQKAVKTSQEPQADWSDFDITRVVTVTDTYEEANKKRKLAEAVSDVDDEDKIRSTRSQRAKKRIQSSDSEVDALTKKKRKVLNKPLSKDSSDEDPDISDIENCFTPRMMQNASNASKKQESLECKDNISCRNNDDLKENVTRVQFHNKSEVLFDKDKGPNTNNSVTAHHNKYIKTSAASSNLVRVRSVVMNPQLNLSMPIETALQTTKSQTVPNTGIDPSLSNAGLNEILEESRKSREFQKKAMEKLNRLEVYCENMSKMMSALNKKATMPSTLQENILLSDAEKQGLSKTFEDMKTLEDFQNFDMDLKKKKYFYKVVEFLRLKGGSSVTEHVYHILNSTLKNAIAMKYSYLGQKGKLKFIETMFNKSIYNLRNIPAVFMKSYQKHLYLEAVQNHIDGTTETELKHVIASWLDNSKTRMKNEEKSKGKRVSATSLANIEFAEDSSDAEEAE